MFKFVFSAFVCAAMCLPAASFAQDCGCGCEPAPAPCIKTRKRLKLVDVQKQVCRLKRVCTTDECGCQKSKLVRVSECVTRKKLTLVDVAVDPCAKRPLRGLVGRLKGIGSRGCCDAAPSCGCDEPAPCGCDAPAAAPCGCNSAPAMGVPMESPVIMDGSSVMDNSIYSAPTEAAPMIESAPMIEAAPMTEAPATGG